MDIQARCRWRSTGSHGRSLESCSNGECSAQLRAHGSISPSERGLPRLQVRWKGTKEKEKEKSEVATAAIGGLVGHASPFVLTPTSLPSLPAPCGCWELLGAGAAGATGAGRWRDAKAMHGLGQRTLAERPLHPTGSGQSTARLSPRSRPPPPSFSSSSFLERYVDTLAVPLAGPWTIAPEGSLTPPTEIR